MKDFSEKKLMYFLETRLTPFTLRDLSSFLHLSQTDLMHEELSEFLLYNQLAYIRPDCEEKDALWITRAGLFTGKTLIITPSRSEIAAGILIPGSRFVPFSNPGKLPQEYLFEFEGKRLSFILTGATAPEVYPLYQLFGEEYTSQYLALDNEENMHIFSEFDYDAPPSFQINAIDMKKIYWRSGFKPGDSIQAKVLDWRNCLFSLSVLPDNPSRETARKKWQYDFENSLLDAFTLAGPSGTIDEQLAFAYFLGQDTLFTENALPVQEFLQKTEKAALAPFGVETRLWFADTEIPSQKSWNMAIVSSRPTLLDNVFAQLGLPLSEILADIYIYDALFLKEDDTEQLMNRLIPVQNHVSILHVSYIERTITHRFKKLEAGYNWFADRETGALRNRFITLHSALTGFILELAENDILPGQIPDQGAIILGQILSHAVSALETLGFSSRNTEEDMDSLWLSIEGMEESFFETKTAIRNICPELQKKKFTLTKKEFIDE
ncbi:hypothetical protein K7I13_06455 [Brucepastera parasyntrophica]|uniref:hypothetical protein n=1 Tax=Brucepastera parasyntrophica TaxID=2880008 RepID=UPI00210AC2D1|nr:hypothetical protein [Brucepastera parasyntrophica]ULQ60897.1 hypothetical protein K7I13_06455 [Brucepastera parasyntrophica]